MKRLSVVALVFVLSTLIGAAPSSAIPAGKAPSPEDPAALPQNEPLTFTPCVDGDAGGYPCSEIDLLAFLPLASMDCGSGNDIWGWTDPLDDSEYALMGCNNGTSFVDVTDPENPVYLGRLPTHTSSSTWRDIKVYQDHAFIVSEAGSHGMQVFDLTELRDVDTPPVIFTATAHYAGFGSAHNVAINEQTGFAYVIGGFACSGGPKFIDIQDPVNPTDAGCYSGDGYTHDAQCVTYAGPDTDHQGSEVCFNSNEDTLTLVDVTNKANPTLISKKTYAGSAYTHQGWLTDDHQYFLLDDELDENGSNPTRTYVWDVRDLDDPELIGTHQGPTNAIDHNQYVKGNLAYQSNYRAGLRLLDVSMVADGVLDEIGYFDIYPSSDSTGFNGTWSNYPYFESGIVIVSGIEQGLFVLQPFVENEVSIDNPSVVEGDTGTKQMTFTLSLLTASDGTISVDWATADLGAVAGEDYQAASGTATFPNGATTATIQVTIFGDTVDENDETFFVNLSNPVNVLIGDGQGIGTIKDDDRGLPLMTISDAEIVEGDSGTSTVKVWVGISFSSDDPVSVDYVTADGSAVAGEDYDTTTGTLTINWPTLQKSISVPVHGDLDDEGNEVFFVELSNPVNAQLADDTGDVIITNDDALTLSCVDPTSAPAAGGSVIGVFGDNFDAGTHVEFGAEHAANIVVVSPTELAVTTPALPAGTLQEFHIHGPLDPERPPLHPQHGHFFADFQDVAPAHPFHDFVEKLFRSGVTAGCSPGNFCPNASVTREQMAVFLLASHFGSDYSPPAATGIFDDVPPGDPFAPWIEDLYGRGITAGCGGNNYCPDDPVTRKQMAVFLLATRLGDQYDPPPASGIFDDVPLADPFAKWIEDLYDRGITGGCGTDPLRYCPDSPVTRGQMSVFLSSTFLLPEADIACP